MSWNKGFTKATHPSVKKISDTMKSRKIDNFKRWRQENKPKLKLKSLKKSEPLAFLVGLILGDGHLAQFPRTESLRITLGIDKPNLWTYALNVLEEVIGKKAHINRRKTKCLDISMYQKNLSKRLGIPLGARAALAIKLPNWIWRQRKYLIACLKGLCEAEASLSIHQPTYTYNFSFANRNQSLLDEVESALKYLGFHPERRPDAVRLRKKREVFEFAELIKFRKYL